MNGPSADVRQRTPAEPGTLRRVGPRLPAWVEHRSAIAAGLHFQVWLVLRRGYAALAEAQRRAKAPENRQFRPLPSGIRGSRAIGSGIACIGPAPRRSGLMRGERKSSKGGAGGLGAIRTGPQERCAAGCRRSSRGLQPNQTRCQPSPGDGQGDQQERAPNAVTIHSRIRRWNSSPLTTFPLGVVEPTLRADPNAINRIPHRSTAIETAWARPPRVAPARTCAPTASRT
jgi:hypothetical protein